MSPLWGIAEDLLGLVGLGQFFGPWLGKESSALITLSLISVWQFVGIPMMLFYAALISIPITPPTPTTFSLERRGPGRRRSEYRIFWLILPLVRPAIATVAVFTMIPVWNDLWFPLILAPGERTKTVTLGAQQFLGQFITDWNAILSSQMIRGLTSGDIK